MTTRVRGPACPTLAWIVLVFCATAPACLTPGQARLLEAQVKEIGRQVDRLSAEQARVLDGLRSLEPAAAPASPSAGAGRLYREGYALFHRGDLAESERVLRSFVETDPGSTQAGEARVLIGRSLLARGRCREAIAELSRVLQDPPAPEPAAQALYTIALCHLRLGETSQAREALREILGSYPTTDVAPFARTRLEGL